VVALSEYRYGQAQNESSVLAYLIRSGVGGAFIHNGQVFVNRGATAMEIGHMQIDRDGRVCECGGRGCLETYLSEGAMLSELQNAAGIESLEEAAARLEGDDPEVSEILDPFGDVLGDASLTLTIILNPDVFLVIARFESISRLLAEHVRSRFYAADSSYITRPPRVIAEEYDPAKACRGATDLVYDAFFALD
jgi:predicted NBD/HSP70 family sugar kinase